MASIYCCVRAPASPLCRLGGSLSEHRVRTVSGMCDSDASSAADHGRLPPIKLVFSDWALGRCLGAEDIR